MSIGVKVTKFGNGWGLTKKFPLMWKRFLKSVDEIPRSMAKAYVDEMRKAIKWQGLAPNSVATIMIKGSGQPLVDKGTMLRSIKVKKLKAFQYYGGIAPNAKTPKGRSIPNLAVAQNAGYIVPVTAEVRKLMLTHGVVVGASTVFFVVPPRPFLERAFAQVQPRLKKISDKAGKDTIKVFRSVKGK